MNLCVVGKGGSGKTSISGTMARLLARRGHHVLAIDGDPNPNLAVTLGIPPERMETMPTLPSDLIEWEGSVPRPNKTLDEVVESSSLEGRDGVTLLTMAKPQKAGTG
jgi:CO dehydrogenase maturation factor